MARVPLVEYDGAPPEVRALYEAMGDPERVLNVTKLIANHPDFLAGFAALVRGLYRHNTLAPRLRELAYLRSSQLNQCHY
jgi:alkylhydroperoxidase family enzyme